MSESASNGAGSCIRWLSALLFAGTAFFVPRPACSLRSGRWVFGGWCGLAFWCSSSGHGGGVHALTIPFAAIAMWAVVMGLGDVLLDWTA